MKSVEQKVNLHIYHAPAHKTGRQLLTQKKRGYCRCDRILCRLDQRYGIFADNALTMSASLRIRQSVIIPSLVSMIPAEPP